MVISFGICMFRRGSLFAVCVSAMTTAVAPRILVADDQPDLVEALRLLLKSNGFQMEAVSSPEAVLAAIERGAFDLLLMDLNYSSCTTSGREGLELLSRIRSANGSLPIFVMTGWGSLDVAIEAMRYGVRDFVQKPWDDAQLVARLSAEVERSRTSTREPEEARRIQRQPTGAAAHRRLRARGVLAAGRPRRRRLLRRDSARRLAHGDHHRRRGRRECPRRS